MIEQISWPTIVWSSCIRAVSSEGAWNVNKELLDASEFFEPVKEIVLMPFEFA